MSGYYSGAKSGGFYGSAAVPPPQPHGVSGFLGNLLGDVRDAAVGLPEGVLQLAEHPVRSVEMGAKATWADWSPLFHGHAGEWWHNTYSHPLAPLLDLATAFTGGAAAAGKLADMGLLGGESALTSSAANTTRLLEDPLAKTAEGIAGRPVMKQFLSKNPGTRLRQNATFSLTSHLAQHLPSWFGDHVAGPGASYERAYAKFLARRGAADSEIQSRLAKAAGGHAQIADNLSKLTAEQVKNQPEWAQAAHAQIAAEMHAGRVLTEDQTRKAIEPALLKYNYENFARHGIPYHDAASAAAGEKLPKGYGYVLTPQEAEKRLGFGAHISRWDTAAGSFEKKMERFGNLAMTRVPAKAAVGADGKLLIAPTKAAYSLGHEASNSATFLKKLWKSPSTVWKYALVGYSPRTVVDNSIGNWTMLAMRQGGHKLLPGVVDTVRQLKGARDANRVLGVSGLGGHWTDKYFLDELNAGFAHSLQSTSTKGGRVRNTLRQGFYPLVHSVADQPVRRTALNAFMRSAPEVKSLMQRGHSFDHAVGSVLEKNPLLREHAVAHIRKIAGDYTGLTKTEQAVRNIIPFYTWDRHIISHTVDMFGEHPGRLAAAQQVSNQGVAKTKGAFGGSLPDFLLGDVPLGGPSGKDGRISAISTTGLNPYSTVPDVANSLAALFAHGTLSPGETIGGQLNPIAAGLAEQLSGQKLGSTQPVATHGGVLPSILVNTAEALPYAKLISTLTGHGQGGTYASKGKTEQHLYSGNVSEILSQLLGLPRKQVSPSAAQRLFQQEQPKGRKKKQQASFYG